MSNNNNRRVRRRLDVPLNLTNYRKNAKNIYININSINVISSMNLYTNIPREIGSFTQLERFSLTGHRLTSLPKEIGLCKNLTDLYLARNNLTSIPKEIGDLKNLEFLGLTQNKLTSIPKEIGLCKKLKYLGLSWNNLTSLPKEIEDLPKLRILELYNNPKLKGISSELRKRGLNIKKNTNTKFINYKYYTNQLSTVTVKRKNLPRLPPNIRENIARKVNTKPKAKNEANKMNVARSSLKAYNNKQKVLTRRYINMLSPAVNKNFRNRVTIRKKIHNFSKTLKNISKNNENN